MLSTSVHFSVPGSFVVDEHRSQASRPSLQGSLMLSSASRYAEDVNKSSDPIFRLSPFGLRQARCGLFLAYVNSHGKSELVEIAVHIDKVLFLASTLLTNGREGFGYSVVHDSGNRAKTRHI